MEEKGKSVGIVIAGIYATLLSYCIAAVFLAGPAVVSEIIKHHNPDWNDKQVSGHAATYQSLFFAVIAGCSFFVLSFLGRLSDFYGRKFLVLGSVIMLFMGTVALAAAYYLKVMGLYFVCSVFMTSEGLANVAGFAYVTDISESDIDKTKNFGIIVASSITGVVIGSFSIGYLIDKNIYIGFLIILIISAINIVFLIFFFKEEPKEVKDVKKSLIDSLNPFKSLFLIVTTNPILTCLVIAFFLVNTAGADTNTDYLYTQYRYKWEGTMNGILSGVTSLATIAWQLLGVRVVQKLVREQWVLVFVLGFSVVINIGYGLAPTGWLFMIVTALGGITTLFIPMGEAQMSNQIDKNNQGTMFGGIITLSYIAQFIGDLSLENSFAFCMNSKKQFFTCPGTPYYIGAFLYFIAFVLLLGLYLRFPPKYSNSNLEHKYVPITSVNNDDEEYTPGV